MRSAVSDKAVFIFSPLSYRIYWAVSHAAEMYVKYRAVIIRSYLLLPLIEQKGNKSAKNALVWLLQLRVSHSQLFFICLSASHSHTAVWRGNKIFFNWTKFLSISFPTLVLQKFGSLSQGITITIDYYVFCISWSVSLMAETTLPSVFGFA